MIDAADLIGNAQARAEKLTDEELFSNKWMHSGGHSPRCKRQPGWPDLEVCPMCIAIEMERTLRDSGRNI